jgi:hypothetical protein
MVQLEAVLPNSADAGPKARPTDSRRKPVQPGDGSTTRLRAEMD